MAIPKKKKSLQSTVDALRNVIPFRAFSLKYLASTTQALTWVVGNFAAGGQDLKADAAGITGFTAGENPFNNWLNSQGRPLFKFKPEALGFHISDLGDNKAKQILIENSRLVLKADGVDVVNEPLIALAPGFGIDTTTTTSAAYTQRHRNDFPVGLFRMPSNFVFHKELDWSCSLFIAPNALAALAALSGSTPAQGISLGPVFYGKAEKPVVPSRGG